MRLTPGQIAIRCYIGMGTPIHKGDNLFTIGVKYLSEIYKNELWPRDHMMLYDDMVKSDIGAICFNNGNKCILEFIKNHSAQNDVMKKIK